jgi:hypothetical protein
VSRELEGRGYTVLRMFKPGWRANKHLVLEIVIKVEEALAQRSEDNIVIVECLDSTALYSRTEEGGDIQVKR